MREGRVHNDIIGVPISRFDRIIEWLLISLLTFMPFAFGAVEAWSEEVVIAFVTAITLCFFLKLIFEKSANLVWSWTYIPIAIFVIVAVFQIIPLPTSFVNIFSPNTVSIKKELLGDLPGSDILLKTMTLSFYPDATKHDLRMVIAVATIFFVVVNVYRRADQIKRLLAAITIIGGAIAVLALAQDIIGNGKIYWIVPTGNDPAYSGTFVNHSHYGQFMNLSIGAALGLVFIRIHEAFSEKKVSTVIVYEFLSSPFAKVLWFLLFVVVLGAATIFVSLTRGGMISMLIAAGFVTLILSSRQPVKGRGWIIALLALGAFVCILYMGFDAVYDRLASLRELHQAQAGRWQILKDISLAWTNFPIFGTGLGTHEVVYPMFDRSTIASLAAYAENEYAQTAEETGVIGLTSLVIFGICICIFFIRSIKRTSVPICSAAYGLGFGLLAILIHSLSDFGQHLPANAFLATIFCALLLVISRLEPKTKPSIKTTTSLSEGFRYIPILLLFCICGIFIWALLSADRARRAEAHWKKALTIEQNLVQNNWPVSNEVYADLISNAADAADYQPENIKYRHWLNVYRWESISRAIDPNTGEVIIYERSFEFVRRIVDELNGARLLCPTYGATYCVVGQLEKFTLGDPKGAENIRKGFKLAPCDPTACFVAGILDVEEKNIEASYEKFSRAIKLSGVFFQSVVDIYINRINRPDLAVAIAGDNTTWLSYVANTLAETEEHKDIVKAAQAQIIILLNEKCSGPDVTGSALASLANIYRKEKDNDAAIEHYRRALSFEYSQVQWRYALAKLLAANDKVSDAIHEARICLRINPEFKAAERLIAELSVLPNAKDNEELNP